MEKAKNNNKVFRIRILLASPGNLSEDRKIVFDIVKTINLDSGQRDAFVAEIVSWETHSRPAAGEYAQGVINSQFPEDIGIFIGMMGSYFGTPTKHWGSGTEEEFRLAYQKWQVSKSPEIMFYFSDAMTPMRNIDAEQLSKRRAFQKEIADLGIYYFVYEDIARFQFELHNHISSAIHKCLKRRQGEEKEIAIPEESINVLKSYDSLLAQNPIAHASCLMRESTSHMNSYGDLMIALNSDIERLTRHTIKEAKKIEAALSRKNQASILKSISKLAEEMAIYSDQLILRIPKLSDELSASTITTLRAIKLIKENGLKDKFPIATLLTGLSSIRDGLVSMNNAVMQVEVGLADWPEEIMDLNIQREIIISLHYDLSGSLLRSIDLLDKLSEEIARD